MKNIQLTLAIGQNDLERKMKQAQKFLAKKEQVRVTILLKGREKSRPESAAERLNKINEDYFVGHGKCVKPATTTNLSLTIMPLGSNG